MSTKEKNEIISQIFMLLSKLVEYDATNGASAITGFPVLVPEAEPVTQPAEQKNAGSDEPRQTLPTTIQSRMNSRFENLGNFSGKL